MPNLSKLCYPSKAGMACLIFFYMQVVFGIFVDLVFACQGIIPENRKAAYDDGCKDERVDDRRYPVFRLRTFKFGNGLGNDQVIPRNQGQQDPYYA